MAIKNDEAVVRELLNIAGITINGDQPYDITVHNRSFYKRLLKYQTLGLGESYMDGWWDCKAPDQLINRVLLAKLQERIKNSLKLKWHILRSKLFNLQRPGRSFQVGRNHYDIGNNLFRVMLDKRLNYSCAYWKHAKNLNEAQEHKLELICKKLSLKPGMKILDLGCGWGSFAKYAAEKFRVHVTGLCVSRNQIEYGKELCKGLPVELKLQDYREAEGKYDRILSIGFMEHVGYKNYRSYMKVVDRTLKENGIFLLHTIGGNESITTANPFTTKYIFPNGMVPSIAQLGKAIEGIFVVEDWHNFGPDYEKTLMAWYQNFEKGWPKIKNDYTERFFRMWRYYLLTSAGGYRSRLNQLWQIVLTKPGNKQPDCRFS